MAAFRILLLALLGVPVFLPAENEDDDGFVPLFNGWDFEGWVNVNCAPSTWSYRDGLLHCTGKPIGEIRTERMYQNFILELEWRHLVPGGNAGVFVWADDITARGVPFHRGIEVQVLENAYGQGRGHSTHGDIFPIHGAKMTPINGRGGSRAFPTEERSRSSPEWNHYRITCIDGEISLAVNGVIVTRGTDCIPRKGYICLESEGGIVDYRNIRIRELPDSPIDPEHVAIANRGFRSLYTGVDLSGWTATEGEKEVWEVKDWILRSKGAGVLSTTEEFADLGFIVDFRLENRSGIPQIQVGGETVISIDPADPFWKSSLEKTKRWNRLEGVLANGKLVLILNGVTLPPPPIQDSAGPGPLRLRSVGPVDWANIYVREVTY